MKVKALVSLATVLALFCLSVAAQDQQPSPKSQDRIIREVRHELLMLPYFGVFDYIAFKVEGDTVTLIGSVVRPVLKSDAEGSIKHIEGVTRVNNQIEVLPPSSMDDQIRLRLFRAIYGDPGLEKYALWSPEADPDYCEEWPRSARRCRRQSGRQRSGQHPREKRPRHFLR